MKFDEFVENNLKLIIPKNTKYVSTIDYQKHTLFNTKVESKTSYQSFLRIVKRLYYTIISKIRIKNSNIFIISGNEFKSCIEHISH